MMSALDRQNFSVDQIIKKIKEEAQNREKEEDIEYEYQDLSTSKELVESSFYNYAKKVGKYLQKLGLHGLVRFVRKNLNLQQYSYAYEMSDFTKYHDEDFIDNAYKLILNRQADPQGKDNFLTGLREGALSKIQIITSLHFSKEGQEQSVSIRCAKKYYILTVLYKIPFISYIVKSLVIIGTLPSILKRINRYENDVALEFKNTTNKHLELVKILNSKESQLQNNIEQLQNNIEQLQNNIQEKLDDKTSTKQFAMYLDAINYAKKDIDITKQSISLLIEEAKKRLPEKCFIQDEVLAITKEKSHNLDSFYVSFEDQFRGSNDDIKEKLKVYLPYIEKVADKKENIEILDVGCGRGEWLALLSDNGYDKIKGIDLNRVMVSISQQSNKDVECIDVLEYLNTLNDESLSVITGFHIIEHLPFDVLITLLKESLRVLKKGGMVIYETPNPRNILVGACDFYLDPTHINPIHPATLKFLVAQSGFAQTKSLILDEGNLLDFDELEFKDFNDYIDIGRDLVVIGYKI